MNGGFGGRFVSPLFGAAVGGIASTEIISETGLEARRHRGRHQPAGHLTPKIAGTVVQLDGIARPCTCSWIASRTRAYLERPIMRRLSRRGPSPPRVNTQSA